MTSFRNLLRALSAAIARAISLPGHLITLAALASSPALAADLEDIVEGAQDTAQAVPGFMAALFYVVALILAVMSIFQLRQMGQGRDGAFRNAAFLFLGAVAAVGAPALLNAGAESFGLTGGSLSPPTLQSGG